MELLNATKMQAGYTMGMNPDGRELLVVVVKGTFQLPHDGGTPVLSADQLPLVEADTFTGEPGLSAPTYESDYTPFKQRCDVLLNGSAYAPGGVAAQYVPVSLTVRHASGHIYKPFQVVGNRTWQTDMFGVQPSEPEFLTVQPISYDVAAGGLDNANPDPSQHEAHPSNPIGKGFFPRTRGRALNGLPLPNTEDFSDPVRDPQRAYAPLGLGPLGRGWRPRPQFAGTYDQDWIDNVFPFLPADFDPRYYQCAPADQQLDYLQGNEEITLVNLTPQGETTFRLPTLQVPVTFFYRNHEEREITAAADTLMIEPDLNRFTIVWRASIPLRRNIFEIAQVVAGRMPTGWYRARALGKTYYPSLKSLADARRSDIAEDTSETAEKQEA